MGIFQMIRSDHAMLRKILDAISQTKGDSVERRKLFTKLLDTVQTHAIAEEQALYTPLMGFSELTEDCRHFVIEHAEVDELLQDLEYEDTSHPSWKIKFYRLRHALERHMEEEETQMLPRAEQVISRAQADFLCRIYRSRKDGFPQVA